MPDHEDLWSPKDGGAMKTIRPETGRCPSRRVTTASRTPRLPADGSRPASAPRFAAASINRSVAHSVTIVLLILLLSWLASATLPPSVAQAEEALTYGDIPDPLGGDLWRVSSAAGPPIRTFSIAARMTGREHAGESFSSLVATLQYTLHPLVTFGASAGHYALDRGVGATGKPLNKRGPGDTRVFFKLRAPSSASMPLSVGLRSSLRIPTGYDQEADGLLPFTSRSVDAEFLALIAYETPEVGVYFNPGISLPGEDWHNELLGGLGVDVRDGLPLGFRAKGEYFTRFDLPEEKLRHEIFGSLAHDIPFGLSLEFGIHRELLAGDEAASEWMLSLGMGRPDWRASLPPMGRHTDRGIRVAVAPVTTRVADPHGAATRLQGTVVRAVGEWAGFEGTITADADYTAHLEILQLDEGNGRGLSIPKILATPHVSVRLLAEVSIEGPQGMILDRLPVTIEEKRGTGMRLLPSGKDEDTWVATTQSRSALREEGVRALAEKAAEEIVQAVARARRRN